MIPQNNHVQIEFKPVSDEPEVHSSGLILTTKEPDATEEAKVIHSGDSDYVVGTMVLFKSYSLVPFKRKGEEDLNFVKVNDIIAAYDPSL